MRVTGGVERGRKIFAPRDIRPTLGKVREAIFSMVDVTDKSFIDLFAGSGMIGIEALSRGAAEVVFVEKSQRHTNYIKRNLENLSYNNYKVLKGDALKVCAWLKREFDIVFIDPPYNKGIISQILLNIIPIINNESVVIAEHYKNESIVAKDFQIVKEKKYGDTVITFLKRRIYEKSSLSGYI